MNTIESEVSEWHDVEIESHDRGGHEFTLNGREIGHIHGEQLVDIPFTKRIRDILIEEKRAEKHHVVPESGWVSYRIHSEEDVPAALWLLRVSYLHHLLVLRKLEESQTQGADSVDINAALAELGVSEALHDEFRGRRANEQ